MHIVGADITVHAVPADERQRTADFRVDAVVGRFVGVDVGQQDVVIAEEGLAEVAILNRVLGLVVEDVAVDAEVEILAQVFVAEAPTREAEVVGVVVVDESPEALNAVPVGVVLAIAEAAVGVATAEVVDAALQHAEDRACAGHDVPGVVQVGLVRVGVPTDAATEVAIQEEGRTEGPVADAERVVPSRIGAGGRTHRVVGDHTGLTASRSAGGDCVIWVAVCRGRRRVEGDVSSLRRRRRSRAIRDRREAGSRRPKRVCRAGIRTVRPSQGLETRAHEQAEQSGSCCRFHRSSRSCDVETLYR